MNEKWSAWKAMPSPEFCRQIDGPAGCGVYQIRNRKTGEYIQFGESLTCQKRMKSFFPAPYGTGTRKNENKRIYILNHWGDLEYRTIGTSSKFESLEIERQLKSMMIHKFNT